MGTVNIGIFLCQSYRFILTKCVFGSIIKIAYYYALTLN